MGTQLSDLSAPLVSLQQSALEAQQRAFNELLASVHGELAKAAVETGKALHARVSPLLEQLVARSGEALVAQSSTLAEVAKDVTLELERDAALRRWTPLARWRRCAAVSTRQSTHARSRMPRSSRV